MSQFLDPCHSVHHFWAVLSSKTGIPSDFQRVAHHYYQESPRTRYGKPHPQVLGNSRDSQDQLVMITCHSFH